MKQTQLPGIRAIVFDAYGTLFDVNSAAEQESRALGQNWKPFAELWRRKQLEYTWIRSLSGNHSDFWNVTSDSLDFALASVRVSDSGLHDRLMNLYLKLRPYPEVLETLISLKASGLKLAILSNGSPNILSAAVKNAGIAEYLTEVYSVESVGTFKPHPVVYQLAANRLNLKSEQICFVSANGWDAYSAKDFGFKVAWCNRAGLEPERIPSKPDHEIPSLDYLQELVCA